MKDDRVVKEAVSQSQILQLFFAHSRIKQLVRLENILLCVSVTPFVLSSFQLA